MAAADAGPAVHAEGPDARKDAGGGVLEGEVVGLGQGPHHELAGGLHVEERDPGGVRHDGLAERADVVERLPQVRQGVGVELSPHAYPYPAPWSTASMPCKVSPLGRFPDAFL